MQLNDFRQLVDHLLKDVPPSYRDGVVAVEVSPKTVPHPLRAEIYTLGECVPLEWSGDGANLQSRVVLYHGSFQALARLGEGDFDWRQEAWDTLTHELRHHLEWRANVAALEAYDWAAEENFKRHDDEPFDPLFYRAGEAIAPAVWKVDDDVFVEGEGGREQGDGYRFTWHGRRYRVRPRATERPLFLVLDGIAEPPLGDVVLVLPHRPSLLSLFRRTAQPAQDVVTVEPLDG